MINYKVWNKIDDINGCSAKLVIEDMKIKESDEIILIYDDISNRVAEIQFKDILRSAYGILEENVDAVGQRYLEIKEEEKARYLEEISAQREQVARISALEEENALMSYALMMGGLI